MPANTGAKSHPVNMLALAPRPTENPLKQPSTNPIGGIITPKKMPKTDEKPVMTATTATQPTKIQNLAVCALDHGADDDDDKPV
jgi:hypothetical protein